MNYLWVYLVIGWAVVGVLLEFSKFNEELPIKHRRFPKAIACAATVAFWPVFMGVLVISWLVAWRKDAA